MSHGTSQDPAAAERPHKAGAFDVRNVIAALIGFYGLVLVLVAIFGDEQSDKTGGVLLPRPVLCVAHRSASWLSGR